MHARTPLIVVMLSALLGGATPVRAQSLADLAKKADDSRKTAKGKVYTNKDVGDIPPASAPPPAVKPRGDAAAATAATPAATTPAAAAAADKGGAKDQAAWADRMKELRAKVDRDTAFAEALQSQINGLTTDFVNRDDPAQRSVVGQNRDKAIAELARVQNDIVADKKAITDAEEEARRSGVPAGWLR